MSVPITDDTTPDPEDLAQYSAGTWKSPVKTPLSLEVSTKVNPEPPRPSPPAGVELQVAVAAPAIKYCFCFRRCAQKWMRRNDGVRVLHDARGAR